MSALRSLLRAKQSTTRLSHPLARYSASGQLSCALCRLALKSDALWGAHVVSKGHRGNVKRREAEEAEGRGKRGREEEGGQEGEGEGEGEPEGKRVKEGGGGLPADFFADPKQAPAPTTEEAQADLVPEDEAEAEADDPELAAFLAGLDNDPPTADAPAPGPSTATATLSAAPVTYEFGAPKVVEDGEVEEDAEAEEEEAETEEERVARERREEAEEIMSRMEEEEREQKEADDKVNVSRLCQGFEDCGRGAGGQGRTGGCDDWVRREPWFPCSTH